ncbi:MAG: metallophosphoesterase [Muribaculaceae bacterium]|nr:metallophosphoesterase [Muribaculaceae bacterium]
MEKLFRFLVTGLAMSSMMTLQAENVPDAFHNRGQWEEMSISYVNVHIGLEAPFSVLHISDTHLTEAYPDESENKRAISKDRTATFGGLQADALARSLNWADRYCDFVVHTGDMIDYQSEANYDLVKKYSGENRILCVGNHEFSPEMWLSEIPESKTEQYKSYTRDEIDRVYKIDSKFQSRVVNGVNFVAIDNVYGTVTPAQVELFDKELAKGLPIVLCMHVPFFSDDMWRANVKYWARGGAKFRDAGIPQPSGDYLAQQSDKTTKEFISRLKNETFLKAILAGHIHFSYQERFSPTANQYVAGPNFLYTGTEILFD